MTAPEAADGYVHGMEEYVIALEKRIALLTHIAQSAVKGGWTMAQLNNELYADRLAPNYLPDMDDISDDYDDGEYDD